MQSFTLLVLLSLSGEVGDSAERCGCAYCQQEALPARAAVTSATRSFLVRSNSPLVDAAELARHAEAMRESLAGLWLEKTSSSNRWTPRCEVVVHGNRASYSKATGSPGASTSGSTLVRFNQGKVVSRRIDLLADRSGRPFETIAHELVHAIFAERFPNAAPPRWAEEGAALLADTRTKQAAHQRDFQQAVRSGTAFRVHDLVRMSDYPPPTRFAAFYGQSLVLVDFLTRRGEPGDFVRFIDRSLQAGHDQALQEVYAISSANELERLWREQTMTAALAVK